MIGKRISRKQYESISRYNPVVKWLRPLCSYKLYSTEGGNYERACYLSIPAYAVLFIPVHLLEVLFVIWDGGLKEFRIESRYITGDHLGYGTKSWEIANEIWEKA